VRWARLRARLLALRSAARQLIVRYLPSEAQHVFALTVLVGLVCGLVAVAFHVAIGALDRLLWERAQHAPGSSWMLWSVLSPALGGLLAGLALAYLVPGARGSGIPQVKEAYALRGGRVPLRDTIGKFVLGALQIGSGGSLGREGPTVQICAGTASFLARATWLPDKAMRRLTPVGVAAGVAAAFNAPIAAVTFTIEEIVGDLDQTVLSGVVVAAALAAVIERSILGTHPVIAVAQTYSLEHASSLVFYALLGVAAALLSVTFTDALLELRAALRRRRQLPLWLQPALGGLGTGIIAVLVLRLLHTGGVGGGGYATLGLALDGRLPIHVLGVLCIAKLLATVSSYGSGGAGGIFAPTLFIGAMIGGVFGYADNAAFGHHGHEVGAFALVGMGAVFAGVVRAPITSVLIIFEMTGGYGLVLPLMIANMSAYALARRMRPIGIYDALLLQDGVRLPRGDDPMHDVKVRLLLATAEPVGSATPLSTLIERLLAARGGLLPCGPDAASQYGLVLLEDAQALWAERELDRVVVAADLARRVPSVPVDAELNEALRVMDEAGVDALPVIDPATGAALGVVTRADLGRFLFHQFARRQKATTRSGVFPISTEGEGR
jgi:CIC family chloride channel protein